MTPRGREKQWNKCPQFLQGAGRLITRHPQGTTLRIQCCNKAPGRAQHTVGAQFTSAPVSSSECTQSSRNNNNCHPHLCVQPFSPWRGGERCFIPHVMGVKTESERGRMSPQGHTRTVAAGSTRWAWLPACPAYFAACLVQAPWGGGSRGSTSDGKASVVWELGSAAWGQLWTVASWWLSNPRRVCVSDSEAQRGVVLVFHGTVDSWNL